MTTYNIVPFPLDFRRTSTQSKADTDLTPEERMEVMRMLSLQAVLQLESVLDTLQRQKKLKPDQRFNAG